MPGNRNTLFMEPEAFEALKARYVRLNEPWTSEEEEELRQMSADNVSREMMSEQLGRTPNAVRYKLKALGLVPPTTAPKAWTAEEETEAVALYRRGMPFKDMAEYFGRSERAVITRLVHLRKNIFPEP